MKKESIYIMAAKLLIFTYMTVAVLYVTNVRQENSLLEYQTFVNELQKENDELKGMLLIYREKESRDRHCSLEMIECNDSSDEP